MTLAQAAREMDKLAKELHRDVIDAVNISTWEGLRFAVQSSSGLWSTAILRKADHPYAKRHSALKLNPGVINAQTGAFRADWRPSYALKTDFSTRGVTAAITNDNEVADYLTFGTMFMHARPVDKRVEARWARIATREILKTVKGLEQRYG